MIKYEPASWCTSTTQNCIVCGVGSQKNSVPSVTQRQKKRESNFAPILTSFSFFFFQTSIHDFSSLFFSPAESNTSGAKRRDCTNTFSSEKTWKEKKRKKIPLSSFFFSQIFHVIAFQERRKKWEKSRIPFHPSSRCEEFDLQMDSLPPLPPFLPDLGNPKHQGRSIPLSLGMALAQAVSRGHWGRPPV